MKTILPFVLLLAACSGAEQRFLIDPPAEQGAVRLGVSSLEVRDVSLPLYADASEILLEGEDGALTQIDNALWADDPGRAVTLAISEQIGRRSSAAVAPEPWPLEEDAQAAVAVTVSQLVGRSNGTLQLTGQYAISSYDRIVRERIQRFDISVPMTSATPQGVAQATGAAISELSGQITTALSR
ncbi:lipoprotein [Salipiger pallidus]|uniref:Lipoprotein n=1 Tax=Salipiger pallidus TaxID=1775170 RepID=A0A8J3EFR2_9RHOB|nr:PqiC family protein [Salipiger pallidus]GGG61709.1 lipoprotein [Salipiger pallidus]